MQSNCCLKDLLKYSAKRKAHTVFFFQHEARPKIPTPHFTNTWKDNSCNCAHLHKPIIVYLLLYYTIYVDRRKQAESMYFIICHPNIKRWNTSSLIKSCLITGWPWWVGQPDKSKKNTKVCSWSLHPVYKFPA